MKKTLLTTLFSLIYFAISAQVTDVYTSLNFPTSLGFVGNDLYIGDILGRTIRKIDITQATPTATTVVSGLSQTRDMLIDGNTMYLAGFGSDNVIKIDLSQANPTAETVVTGVNRAFALAKSGNTMYASNTSAGNEKIIKFDVTDANPTLIDVIDTQNTQITDMQVSGNYIYAIQFFPAANDRIVRFDMTAATPTLETVFEDGFNADRIHIVGDYLYFSQASDPNNPGLEIVQRINITETNPTATVVASAIDDPDGLTHKGNEIYIAEFRGNKISKFTDNVLSTKDFKIQNTISIYPNPTKDILKINGLKKSYPYTIYSLSGLKIQQGNIDSTTEINIQQLAKGMYLLTLEDTGIQQKIIKE